METRGKAELDPNGGVIKRRAIKQGRSGSTCRADMKRKPPCCCYSSGCFRILLSPRAPSCRPATRMLRNLREKSEAALRCLASIRGKRLKVSSSAPTRSKQPAAAFDSHRNQAVEDCISYINSSTAPSSATSTSTSTLSSSSSLSSTVILPPPQIPPKFVVTEPVVTVSTTLPPPLHLPSTSNPQCESSKGLVVEKSTRSSCL